MKILIFLLLFPLSIFASIKVAFVGDSITVGVLTEKSYVELLKDRYSKEKKDIILLNRGIGGLFMNSVETITLSILSMDRPDYIIYLVGTCDSLVNTEKEELKISFDKAFSKIGGNCKRYILGMIEETPTNPYYALNTLFPLYQYLSDKYKPCIYLKTILTKEVLKTATDKVHPTDKGHEIIADIVYEALHEVGAY